MILFFLFLFLECSHETHVPLWHDIAETNRQSRSTTPIVLNLKPYLAGNGQLNFVQTKAPNVRKTVLQNLPLFHDEHLQLYHELNQHQQPSTSLRLQASPHQNSNWQTNQPYLANHISNVQNANARTFSPLVPKLHQFKISYSPKQQQNHPDLIVLKTSRFQSTKPNIPLKSQYLHQNRSPENSLVSKFSNYLTLPLKTIDFQPTQTESPYSWNFANLFQRNAPNDVQSHHLSKLLQTDRQGKYPPNILRLSKLSKPLQLINATIPLPKNLVKSEGTKPINQKRRNKPKKIDKISHTEYFENNPSSGDKSLDFPTKPIYPGEGIWAQPGRKHKLIISKNRYKKLKNNVDETPGYEIFVDAKEKLSGVEDKLNLQKFPHNLNLDVEEEPRDDYEDIPPEMFVPHRTYAQVRKTFSKKYLPPSKEEESLKESIKDSRIHVLYSEEGYEDSGYDHGDQEKNAESTDGYSHVDDETVGYQKKIIGSESTTEDDFPEHPQAPSFSEVNYEELEGNKNEESFHGEAAPVNQETINPDEKNTKEELSTQRYKQKPETTDDLETKLVEKLIKNEDVDELSSEDNLPAKRRSQNSGNKQNQENLGVAQEELIDNVQDESQFGVKIKLKRSKRSSSSDSKYPYYESTKLDKNSPMRYTENLENIPDKRNDPMAFYNNADKIDCPEVADVDPIPARKQNEGRPDTAGKDDKGTQKLGKLGDKIDCLKARYFGEDPFDNPIFHEEIGPLGDIFKTFDKDTEDYDGTTKPFNETDEDRVSRELSEDGVSSDEKLPEASPYIILQRRRLKRPSQKHPKYRYHSRYVSRKPPQQLIDYSKPTERISEVHYKDEIKPSEQMNVFADIINNIKNSTFDLEMETSNNNPVTVKAYRSTRRSPTRYKSKKPSRPTTRSPRGREQEIIKQFYLTSTIKPFYPTPVNDEFIPNDGGFIPMRHPQDENLLNIDYSHENSHPFNSQKTRKRTRKPQLESPDLSFEEPKKRKRLKPLVNQADSTRQLSKEIVEEPVTMVSGVHQNHRPVYHDLEFESTNVYNVIGMRPPPEKPTYAHQMTYHPVRRRATRPVRRRVFRRSTRRGYSEIRRENKQVSDENPPLEGEEEYIPYRNRNFHYDEVKKKIVYDNNNDDKEESFEYDDLEMEEPTTKAVKVENKRLVFPSKPPEGPSYIDFVKLLKNNPNYVEIPDPTTPKIEATTTAPLTSTTYKPTEPPEFLNILAKVRSNENYKVIEDRKSKTTTTTETSIDEENDDLENVKNSPGGHTVSIPSSNADDGNESEVKRYNPRTSIDTSKYTSIERTPLMRPNISSHYFEEDTVLELGNISEKLMRPQTDNDVVTTTETLSAEVPSGANPTATQVHTTDKNDEIAINKQIVARGRRRFTTTLPTTIETTRRSRTRLRSRVTTEEPSEQTRNRRNLGRRAEENLTVPRNHKSSYTPINSIKSPVMAVPSARSITANLLRHTNVTDEKMSNKDVDLLKKFDPRLKHGGNYRYKKVEISISRRNMPPTAYEIEDSEEIKRLSDVVPKPFAFYSDPKLPSHINRLRNSRYGDISLEEPEDDEESDEIEEKEQDVDIYDDVIGNSKPEVTTKKTRFIKDPSKRMYFYAPV